MLETLYIRTYVYMYDIFSVYKTTILLFLVLLKISSLYDAPTCFYEHIYGQNWMCELCTFSQIQSHVQYARKSDKFKNHKSIPFITFFYVLKLEFDFIPRILIFLTM